MRHLPLLLIAAAAALATPRPARACSIATYEQHELDPAFADDTTPPSAPVASAEVLRHEEEGGGCAQAMSSCGDVSLISLQLAATDDRAPAERLGYRLKVVGGEAPFPVPGDLRPHLGLDVASLPIGDARGFMFALEIRAVDLNGNVGAPVVLTIVDEPQPEAGCSIGAGGGSAASLGLALGGLAVALRRRRG